MFHFQFVNAVRREQIRVTTFGVLGALPLGEGVESKRKLCLRVRARGIRNECKCAKFPARLSPTLRIFFAISQFSIFRFLHVLQNRRHESAVQNLERKALFAQILERCADVIECFSVYD